MCVFQLLHFAWLSAGCFNVAFQTYWHQGCCWLPSGGQNMQQQHSQQAERCLSFILKFVFIVYFKCQCLCYWKIANLLIIINLTHFFCIFNVYYISAKKIDVEEKLFFFTQDLSLFPVFSDKLKHKCTKSFDIQLESRYWCPDVFALIILTLTLMPSNLERALRGRRARSVRRDLMAAKSE